jgi:hypothetical protein
MTIIPNNPANDKASNASIKRNAELKSSFFRKDATVAIKKIRLRRAAHVINITSMFGIVILLSNFKSYSLINRLGRAWVAIKFIFPKAVT